MDDAPVTLPLGADLRPVPQGWARLPRWVAALQVVLVCGIPTQLFVATALVISGVSVNPTHVSLEFFATLSLFDTALIALLIRLFLSLSGETSRDVFIGAKPVGREAWLGAALLPGVFVVIAGVIYGLRTLLPWLHNVPESPLAGYMNTPLDAAIFTVVVVLAGGVREELARAFILHRFEQRLGGARVGLVVFSLAFGALHLTQGFDAALAVGLLGLLWGVLYLRRGSVVASMVNHAGFDAAQVLQVVVARMLSS